MSIERRIFGCGPRPSLEMIRDHVLAGSDSVVVLDDEGVPALPAEWPNLVRGHLRVNRGGSVTTIRFRWIEVGPDTFGNDMCLEIAERRDLMDPSPPVAAEDTTWIFSQIVGPRNGSDLSEIEDWLVNRWGTFVYCEGLGVFAPDGTHLIRMS
jgi:hypothetical protein